MNIFLGSDPHCYHNNIIKYCNRPFTSAEEMTDHIIRKHNSIVGINDTYICLGDFCFSDKQTKIDTLARFNGKNKILIRGNHDSGMHSMYDIGFNCVCESMIIKEFGFKILLNHYPLLDKQIPPDIRWVVCGHVHNSSRSALMSQGEPLDISEKNLNISAEMVNYSPVNVRYLLKNETKLRLVNQLKCNNNF